MEGKPLSGLWFIQEWQQLFRSTGFNDEPAHLPRCGVVPPNRRAGAVGSCGTSRGALPIAIKARFHVKSPTVAPNRQWVDYDAVHMGVDKKSGRSLPEYAEGVAFNPFGVSRL
ncbi:MAG: hypothetical protein HYR84_10335 [Planctomycetes bacterium]|nr:hypothetical protein [Planctomycetota bacterium]